MSLVPSRILFFCLAVMTVARASPGSPLQEGEHLTYKVSWAIVPGAGEIKIDAHRDATASEPRLKVVTTTATRRLARALLPFDARAESVFELKSGRLLSLTESSTQRGKTSEHAVEFDYAARTARYSVPGATEAPRTLPMPAGDPMDLIMGLLETRTWNLKEGETRDSLVLFDDEFYELTIHAARYEDVITPLGTFKTTVLEPRMDKTPPKGMFKRGSTVRVWIAQDAPRLPVKFEVEFKIGTGTATLVAYEPPTADAAAAKPAGKAPDAKDSRP